MSPSDRGPVASGVGEPTREITPLRSVSTARATSTVCFAVLYNSLHLHVCPNIKLQIVSVMSDRMIVCFDQGLTIA